MFTNSSGSLTAVGVVSFYPDTRPNARCLDGHYAVITQLGAYRDFIADPTRKQIGLAACAVTHDIKDGSGNYLMSICGVTDRLSHPEAKANCEKNGMMLYDASRRIGTFVLQWRLLDWSQLYTGDGDMDTFYFAGYVKNPKICPMIDTLLQNFRIIDCVQLEVDLVMKSFCEYKIN